MRTLLLLLAVLLFLAAAVTYLAPTLGWNPGLLMALASAVFVASFLPLDRA